MVTVMMVEVVVGSPSRWSLLAFTVQAAKMGSVPTEGDHCLSLAGEAGAEDASGLPGRNSCHRQLFSPCGGAWRVVATMVVVVRALATMAVEGGGGVLHATHFFHPQHQHQESPALCPGYHREHPQLLSSLLLSSPQFCALVEARGMVTVLGLWLGV